MLESNFLMFVIPIVTVVCGLLGYIAARTHGRLRKYLNTTGKQVLFGLIFAIAFPTLIALVLSTIAYGERVEAEELNWRFLDHTDIVAGLETPIFGSSQFCYKEGVNDKLTSNIGIYQQLAGKGDVDYYVHYIHHSCAINQDKPTYDAIGLSVHWRIDWKRK